MSSPLFYEELGFREVVGTWLGSDIRQDLNYSKAPSTSVGEFNGQKKESVLFQERGIEINNLQDRRK